MIKFDQESELFVRLFIESNQSDEVTFMLGRLGLDKVRNEFDEFDVDDDDVETFRRVDGDGGRSVREVSSDALPDNCNQTFNQKNNSLMVVVDPSGNLGENFREKAKFYCFSKHFGRCICNNSKNN